jgi:putative FmdB family regulatory protein
MPIYEYACKKCGKTIEVIQKFSDTALKKHSGCGGTLTKLISASGFQFKGTGWYVTDYAKKSGGPASETKESAPKTDSTSKEAAAPAASKPASEPSKKSSDS